DGIRDRNVTGVQTCALPILSYSTRKGSSRPARIYRTTIWLPPAGPLPGLPISSKQVGPACSRSVTSAAATSSVWRRPSARDRSLSRSCIRYSTSRSWEAEDAAGPPVARGREASAWAGDDLGDGLDKSIGLDRLA